MPLQPLDILARRAASRVGTTVRGKYHLDRVLGVGGMAAVYAATHRHGHRVAIKVLHDRLSSEEESFLREAKLANRVGHPGVIKIQDDDVTEDGCVFLVMELLEGETLRARWERSGHRLPPPEVAAIASELLNILAAAHAKEIVHRDIKPENVFLTTSGQLKVLDFGIARTTSDPVTVTKTGHAKGTPAFMAPEQGLGRTRDIDAQTDLWSVGATMFTLLSGQYVHEGDTANEFLVYTATRPARSLRSVAPEIPTALGAVVDRALAFEKADRWPNATAMGAALHEACGRANIALLELSTLSPRMEEPVSNDHVR